MSRSQITRELKCIAARAIAVQDNGPRVLDTPPTTSTKNMKANAEQGNNSCPTSRSTVTGAASSFVSAVTDALDAADVSDDAVANVAETGENLVDAVADLEEQVDESVDDETNEVEIRGDGLADLWIADYPVGRIVDGVRTDCNAVESRVDALEDDETEDATAGVDGATSPAHKPESPLEQVVGLPEHATDSLSANQERARFVAKDIADYGTSVPAGVAITAGEIRRILVAKDEDSRVHPETVSRVITFLDDLGKEDVTVKKRRGERRIIFDEDAITRYQTAASRDLTTCVMGSTVG